MERILIIMRAYAWVDAAPALYSARNASAWPNRLSFGLVLGEEMREEELLELYALGAARHETGDADPWQAAERLWQGETYLLMAHPSMRFDRHWDKKLLAMLAYARRQGEQQVVVTGCPPCPEDMVDAVSPVAACAIDHRGRLTYRPGTPLRYARHPMRAAFPNPYFCFAPSAFFRLVGHADVPRFLCAYQNRWHFYTASSPAVRMLDSLPLPPDCVRSLPECAASFGLRFGVDFQTRTLSPMAQCGIFEHTLSFDTRVPLPVRAQEALRCVKGHLSPLSPLCVTAWLQLPDSPLDDTRMAPFRRLCAMKNLPLLCYADHQSAPRIVRNHPNVLEYRRRYGLSVSDGELYADPLGYVRLCKPFMLARSREKFMSHSHYVWIDFDYLRYPVYERAALDWSAVCGDRIVMATVDGVPDARMIVVPQDRLEPLCREISALCQLWRTRKKALPSESELWLRLMRDHPDWFRTLPQSRQAQLFARIMTPRGSEWATRAQA